MSKAVEPKAVAKKTTAKSYKLVGLSKGSHLLNGVEYKWEAGEDLKLPKKVFDVMKLLNSLEVK
jgi:hypothetical protein